jgi:hypothetical protein
MNYKLSLKDRQTVAELKNELLSKHGSFIEWIYCYGSRVYERREDTDFDILIVTHKRINWT